MKFSLITVNLPVDEYDIDKDFETMDALLAFVNEDFPFWTSLVVTVLPSAKGADKEQT